jgi:hypothetical protein
VCNFLQETSGKAHLTCPTAQWQVRRYFHEIRLGDVDRTHGYEAHKVSGSRSKHAIHSIFHLNKTLLHVRELSCFYKFCVDGGDGPCDNYTHVQPWDLMALEPYSSIDVRCDPDIDDMREVSHDGESLVACLEVGDYFVITATNDVKDNVGFWGFNVHREVAYGNREKHVDAYGQMFLYNNQVVISKYFKQQGRSPHSYVQCDMGETYIYSHLIKAMKF